MKKLTEKELKSLQDCLQRKNSVVDSLGQLELGYQSQKKIILDVYEKGQKEYRSLLSQFQNKYGDDATVNPNTGEITKKV